MVTIKKGMDLPIMGEPQQQITNFNANISRFALVADDYLGLKPKMLVQEGDEVKIGQPLFVHKLNDTVQFVSPANGKVLAIHRGEKRKLLSVVVSNEGDRRADFSSYKGAELSSYNQQELIALLAESGWWTSFRTRPFSKIPHVQDVPCAIFVNMMDTQPLAAKPTLYLEKRGKEFNRGLKVLEKLFSVPVHVCAEKGFNDQQVLDGLTRSTLHHFSGVHPAGNVGTHIHFIRPVSEAKRVWHVDLQDVVALGHLLSTGQNLLERMISMAGPLAKEPKIFLTRVGACLSDLAKDQLKQDKARLISGSVFGGRTASEEFNFLGRYHRQMTLIKEGTEREFLGWQSPGLNKYSFKPVFLSKLFPAKKFSFTTNTNGSLRAIVPTGAFEKVMPLDILPTHLIQALLMKNTERATQLGALELDEEDLALCSFVDPCKNELGPVLRENLDIIEKEG